MTFWPLLAVVLIVMLAVAFGLDCARLYRVNRELTARLAARTDEVTAERARTHIAEQMYQQEKALRVLEREHYVTRVREMTDMAEYWRDCYDVVGQLADAEDVATTLRKRVQ